MAEPLKPYRTYARFRNAAGLVRHVSGEFPDEALVIRDGDRWAVWLSERATEYLDLQEKEERDSDLDYDYESQIERAADELRGEQIAEVLGDTGYDENFLYDDVGEDLDTGRPPHLRE